MEFPKYKQVKQTIRAYKRRKLQIRLPGGVSLAGDKNANVGVPDYNDAHKVYFCGVPYDTSSRLPDVFKKKKESRGIRSIHFSFLLQKSQ